MKTFAQRTLAYYLAAGGLALMPLLSSCNLLLRPTPTPIPTQAFPHAASERAATLVVWLPGRRDSPADFARHGIVETLREAGIKADVIAVDAHLGYYFQRTVIERLRADVLVPARRQGYQRIILAGVSLGGLGALFYERDHPGEIDAVVLLGPYLGKDDTLFDRIAAAGGPAAWATGRDLRTGRVEEQLWTFLGTKSPTLPPTWLLCGRQDTYARGHRLLGELLPSARVVTIEGGHDWPTWLALWHDLCSRAPLFQAERNHPLATIP